MSSKFGGSNCFLLGVTLFFFLSITSCKSKKDIATKGNLVSKNAPFLLKQVKNAEYDCEWLSLKSSVEVNSNGNNQSFKANIRIRKDSAIWLSLTPALGIEVARIILTKDSIKYVDKLQKKFFLGTFKEINNHFESDFSYDLFQNFFFGNPIEMDPGNKYISTIDGDMYLLSTRSKPKIRKAIGLKKDDLKSVSPDSTLNLNIQKKRYDRIKGKASDDDLLIVRYWINPQNYKVSSLLVNDLKRQGVLEINFGGFVDVENGIYPLTSNLYLTLPGRMVEVQMEYKKPKINGNQSFPFRIPDKYEQIYY